MKNLEELMRQAQEMQKRIQKEHKKLAGKLYEGDAGGGMVKAVFSGAKVFKKVDIDPSLFKIEEKDVLEDLLVAAINNALEKVKEDSDNSLPSLLGGLPLPDEFKA